MLVKNFARRAKMMSFEESFSIVQALIIFHSPSFLSSDHTTRISGLMFLTYIVQIARQVGLFRYDAEWSKLVGIEGLEDCTDPENTELDRRWKAWIKRETVRRTTWLVYVLDITAAIEASTTNVTTARDLRHFPLPAAAPIWNARTAMEWLENMRKYPIHFTLEQMMNKTFDLRAPRPPTENVVAGVVGGGPELASSSSTYPIELAFADTHGPSTSRTLNEGYANCCLGTRVLMGPFARLCVVLTLVRGLVEFGEGKRKGGQVSQIWATWPEPMEKPFGSVNRDGGPGADGVAAEAAVLVNYKRAFDRVSFSAFFFSLSLGKERSLTQLFQWRMGWDIDRLCHWPYPSPTHPCASLNTLNPAFDPSAAPCALGRESSLMHDATPYFWLGTVLIDLLRTKMGSPGVLPRPGVFGDLDDGLLGEDGEGEDPRVNLFKGLDYRGMLDVAKQFAHSGEGI